MSSELKTLTRKQLSKKLAEKHKTFLEKYMKEFDFLHKLLVLEEKQDLLEHWIKDARDEDDGKKVKEYMKQKKRNDDEISEIRKGLSDLNKKEEYEVKQRYEFLKDHMDSHREAIDYWTSRQNERERT
ncbi:MAG: hypothetical protein JW778_02760 [Candidatus Altiarchaeota archaeon]|nr:hypothetical protein [Candidatus Altiarchaeota archaeon]